MNSKIKKIFITGLNGYIGNLFKIYLNKYGYEVVNQNHEQPDVTISKQIMKSLNSHQNIDLIIHLASVNFYDEQLDNQIYKKINTIGTQNVLYWANDFKIPVLTLIPQECIFYTNPCLNTHYKKIGIMNNYNDKNITIITDNIFSFYHDERSVLHNLYEELMSQKSVTIVDKPIIVTNFEQMFDWLHEEVFQNISQYQNGLHSYFDCIENKKVPNFLSIVELMKTELELNCTIDVKEEDINQFYIEDENPSVNLWSQNVKKYVKIKKSREATPLPLFSPVELGIDPEGINFKMYFDADKVLDEIG